MASYCIIQPSTIRHNGQLLFEARAGEEQSFFLEAYRYFAINYPKFHKMDRFCQLGFLSALPIVPEKRRAAPSKTGVLLASKSGSIHTDQHYYEKVFTADNILYSPAQFTYTLPSAILGELCIKHNIQGENYFLLHGAHNLDLVKDYAKQLFHTQQLDACLIGWMDYYTKDQFQSCYVWLEREDLIDLDTIIININKICFDYGKATVS